MSTADQVESYVGRAPKSVRVDTTWAGRHRVESRAQLSIRRMFYASRHRMNRSWRRRH